MSMEITLWEFIPIITVSGLFLIQFVYWQGIYKNMHRRIEKPGRTVDSYPPLSVIIVAKNARAEIEKNLPAVLNQDYPAFEVIVVHDRSATDCDDVLKRLETRYVNLYHTFIPESARYISRKKLGLSIGIKASHYDWLVFTEIYCRPESNQWLKKMAAHFTEETDIVLGYSNYERRQGWFNKKICYDRLIHSMRFLGMALVGRPYTGSGKNLAYRKSLYARQNGFTNQLNWDQGEDMLFVNQAAEKKNTRVEVSKDSIVRIAMPTKRMWNHEKVNEMATSQLFKGMGKYGAGFETLTRMLFFLAVLTTVIYGILSRKWIMAGAAALLYVVRLIIQVFVIRQAAEDFDKRRYGLSIPLFDLLQPLWHLKFKTIKARHRKDDFQRKINFSNPSGIG